jgi:uncharacterized protein (DUF983 family)
MLKGTKLYSILFNKCPRCQEGDFFVTSHIFTKNFDKMHKECPICGEKYTPEPGFYFGSAYVSYALYVALIVVSFVGYVVILGGDPLPLLYFLIPAFILVVPLFYRLARRTWLNIFVKYDKRPTNSPPSNQ